MKTSKLIKSSVKSPGLALAALCVLLGMPRAEAQVQCDTNTVKYLQPPNPDGYDISDSLGYVMADDFVCTDTGPVSGIHIWGSWLSDQHGVVTNFWLGIYSDVPATTNASSGMVTPSHPGGLMWSQAFPAGQFVENEVANSQENFISPASVNIIGTDTQIWYYCFTPTNPFTQTGSAATPTVYWLAAYAQGQNFGPQYNQSPQYGWKTTPTVQNDVSVFTPWPGSLPGGTATWNENTTPANSPVGSQPLDLAFELTEATNSQPTCCPEGNTVKYVQPPNLQNGIDIDARDIRGGTLADDFPCSTTGPITDIHVWGSWLSDQFDFNAGFILSIWSDVPASPASGMPSHPGTVLWTQTFGPQGYNYCPYASLQEPFEDPNYNPPIPPVLNPFGASTNLYYLCFYPTNPFVQMGTPNAPTNYWLSLTETDPQATGPFYFGWKTSSLHYNDAAVYTMHPPTTPWTSLVAVGGGNFDLAFQINTTTNCTPTVRCVGDKTVYCSSGTTWSFDGPVVIDPCCAAAPTITTNIVTNSITACSQSYTATFTISDCNGIVGSGCQQTVIVLDTNAPYFLNCVPSTNVDCGTPWTFNQPIAQYVCSSLNAVVGILSSNVSMQSPCITVYTVDWSATNQCNGAVAFCQEQVVVKDTNAPVISCGTNFTVEWPNSWTFTPPTAVYACSGASVPVNILSSNVNLTQCGTTNTIVWSAINQCNDAMATCTQVVTVVCPCQETNGIIKYTQPPNTTSGYDVWNSTTLPPNADDGPWLLADDFVCTNTGYITDIHLWGSWLNNAAALDSITFWLGLFTDNPTNANNPYSTPGGLVWSQCFAPGEYSENFWSPSTEYFLDPGPPSILGTDSVAWYYCFYPTNPPIQHGSTLSHKTYWLAVYAQLPSNYTNYFGWKSTTTVQNDVSVHSKWVFGACPLTINPAALAWMPNRVATGAPLDLAFQISTLTNCAETFLTIDPYTNNMVIVQWPSGVLQGATNVLGPYVDMLVTSPYITPAYPLPPTNRFFRVKCN